MLKCIELLPEPLVFLGCFLLYFQVKNVFKRNIDAFIGLVYASFSFQGLFVQANMTFERCCDLNFDRKDKA